MPCRRPVVPRWPCATSPLFLLGLAAVSQAQGLVLSELAAANKRTVLDEDGRSSDWIELWNRGSAPVDLDGHALSDDPLRPQKWRLPAVLLGPGDRYLVWASNKDRTAVPARTLQKGRFVFQFDRTLVRAGEVWRYLVSVPGEPGPPGGWTALDFDDSGLHEGPSGFGFDDNDDATLVPEGTQGVFLRRRFRWQGPRLEGQLLLKVDYDDGFVAYLNGVQVASANAPAAIDFNSLATVKHDAGQAEYFDISAFARGLRPGENVLAIAALNTTPSKDMSMIPELGTLPLICHASFELKADGGELILTAPGGAVLDRVQYGRQLQDRSYGRSDATPETWSHFATPTPRQANSFLPFAEPPEALVAMAPPPGWSSRRLDLTLRAESRLEGLEVRYTLDGSVPVASSKLAEGTLRLAKNAVVRAAAFLSTERISDVVTGSYFIGAPPGIHVVSMALPARDFAEVHMTQAAHGFPSERAIHLEIFDPAGERVTATGAGFRLHGGYGRQGGLLTKKSYRIYFRPQYGDEELRHSLIPGVELKELDQLVLRANFNDRLGAYNPASTNIRDEILRRLHRDMGAVASAGGWCLLHANMTPRGLYNVVERLDEEFLRRHLGGKSWTIVKTGNALVSGSRQAWDELLSFAGKADGSRAEDFQRLQAAVDLDAFTSYVILNLWSQNEDWPQNNWYAAREDREGARWLFLAWDGEWGLGHTPSGHSAPSFTTFLGKKGHGIRDIFAALIRNAGYRQRFLDSVDAALAGPLGPANVTRRIDEAAKDVAPFMDLELRLNARGFTLEHWEANVEALREFAARRGKVFRRFAAQAMAEAASAPPAGTRGGTLQE